MGLTKFLGTKVRDVSDNLEDLYESVKKRWYDRQDYRPENLKKHSDRLKKV